VWFVWTAPSSGLYEFSTCGTQDFDSIIAVYQGPSVSQLTLIASDDDTHLCTDTYHSAVVFAATEGQTYRIAVDGYNDYTSNFDLIWQPIPSDPPSNDAFENRTTISGATGMVAGDTTLLASRQVGEPFHAGDPSGSSVWFQWTAPSTGNFRFDTCGSEYDTVLAVYSGKSLAKLSRVAANDNNSLCSTHNESMLVFGAKAQATYVIAVAGNYGLGGNYVLNWEPATAAGTADLMPAGMIMKVKATKSGAFLLVSSKVANIGSAASLPCECTLTSIDSFLQ
jgi:hypothetical protein